MGDEVAQALVEAFRPGSLGVLGKPLTPQQEDALVRSWTDWPDGFRDARFYFPRPSPQKPPLGWGHAEIVVGRASGRYMDDKGNRFELPFLVREPGHWYNVVAGEGSAQRKIDHQSQFEMMWFLGKVLLTLPIYRPEFAFADLRDNIFQRVTDAPDKQVWPVLVYGPALVERLGGRERLLDAPAWRVDDLPGGSLWIQVAENPFAATDEELHDLATFLGLPSRLEA